MSTQAKLAANSNIATKKICDTSYFLNIKNSYTEDFYDIDGFQNVIRILNLIDLKPTAPQSTTNAANTTFLSAVSECLFSSFRYRDTILNKSLRLLNSIMSSPLDQIPLRLKKLKLDDNLLDKFMTNPTNKEYMKFLVDLVSISFKIKISLFNVYEDMHGNKSLDCTSYSNKFNEEIKILVIDQNMFIALKDKAHTTKESEDDLQLICQTEATVNSLVNKILLDDSKDFIIDDEELVVSTKEVCKQDIKLPVNVKSLKKESSWNDESPTIASTVNSNKDHFSSNSDASDGEEESILNFSDSLSRYEEYTASIAPSTEEAFINLGCHPMLEIGKDDLSKIFPKIQFLKQNSEFSDQAQLYSSKYAPTNNKNQVLSQGQLRSNVQPFRMDPNVNMKHIQSHKYELVYDKKYEDQTVREEKAPKRIILGKTDRRYTGTLKYFDYNKGYGFVTIDANGTDIFLHCDDLVKANIDIKEVGAKSKGNPIKFSFCCLDYMGKHNKSRKIVDVCM